MGSPRGGGGRAPPGGRGGGGGARAEEVTPASFPRPHPPPHHRFSFSDGANGPGELTVSRHIPAPAGSRPLPPCWL